MQLEYLKDKPNLRRLVSERAATIMAPKGANVGAIAVQLVQPGRLGEVMKEAMRWTEIILVVFKQAPDAPESWKTATDEELAGIVLAEVDKRKLRG